MSDYAGTYQLDNTHTRIGFIARHAMVTKVRGQFTDWDAEINSDNDPAVKVVVKTSSIDTGNADRDNHTKGEDFFDVEKYPEMTFESTKVDLDNGTLEGNLTIKETTKPVTLDVEIFGQEEDPFGNVRVGFDASAQINRKHFGIDFNAPLNSGGVLVSDKITIEIEGSAIKQ
ncbi:polyisoprenoid-binding protein [Corynebacterium yudongzhengii]|uniref:Polyisoprenoid-binding protein n=1 Tax=Corynebacterium yudongzhengii TaxID=2080740 RepID=A0A2U1T9H3_9CORY|nr:YceI family protein [Corynebacterium yudongzhengii]AWB82135.1 polyisoprenoid-binding protein [Corynebacterium yudongzhengii]PWC02639.1 polyisoprenoid-binding protein [Corynebacterium yudongzhengii]